MWKTLAIVVLVLGLLVGCEQAATTTVKEVTVEAFNHKSGRTSIVSFRDSEGTLLRVYNRHYNSNVVVVGSPYDITIDEDFELVKLTPILSGVEEIEVAPELKTKGSD